MKILLGMLLGLILLSSTFINNVHASSQLTGYAGKDQTVWQKSTVTLEGSSRDPLKKKHTYDWRQISGDTVKLSATNMGKVSFMAPQVDDKETKKLVFELTVRDDTGRSAKDTVIVYVQDSNTKSDTKLNSKKSTLDNIIKETKKKTQSHSKKDIKQSDATQKTMSIKSVNDAKKKTESAPNKKFDPEFPIEITIEITKGTATNQKCGNKCFIPNHMQIIAGDKITWKNTDSLGHTATSINNDFDTSVIKPGKSFSNIFKTVGEFPYVCIIHPWMKGQITVIN